MSCIPSSLHINLPALPCKVKKVPLPSNFKHIEKDETQIINSQIIPSSNYNNGSCSLSLSIPIYCANL